MARGASDLHLACGSPPSIRLNGRLLKLDGPSLTGDETQQFLVEVLSENQQQRFKADERLDCSISVQDIGRFRCHFYWQRGSVAAAIRAIPLHIPNFEDLGLPPIVRELVMKPQGLLLVTGPTGSGKSTTLAAMIDQINEHSPVHIVTLEDPIEFLHSHKKALVSQQEIGADVQDLQSVLKSVLRQDPDVVILGELRDLETIQTALILAETGHLTIATLHTNSAVQTLHRIILAFPSQRQAEVRSQLSMVLEGVISQRLIPNLTGKERVLALEVMIPIPAVRNLIRDDKIHQIYSMMQTGQAKHGMQTMNQALADFCKQQIISGGTAMAFTNLPEELTGMLDRMGGQSSHGSAVSRVRSK